MEHQEPTSEPEIRVVGAGVDSLYLSHRLEPKWSVVRELEVAKLTAGRARRAATDPRTGEVLDEVQDKLVALGGRVWRVMPYGSAEGPYLLRDDDFQMAINPEASGGAPALTAKCLASALWRDGAPALVRAIDEVAAELAGDGTIEGRYVRRIDVACDFQGWTPQVSDFELFCTPGAPTRELHPEDEPVDESLDHPRLWARWRLTGFRFGKHSTIVRLYNKSEEIVAGGGAKKWFEAVWARAPGYVPTEPVWRLEVQAPRAWLKDLRTAGGEELAESIESTLAGMSSIWRTVLTERVRLTNGDATRLTRASIRPAWAVLTATPEIDGAIDGGRVTKVEQMRMTAEMLTPKLRGYLATWAALRDLDDFDDAVLDAADAMRELSEKRAETFEALVQEKTTRRATSAERVRAMDARAAATRAERERQREEPCPV